MLRSFLGETHRRQAMSGGDGRAPNEIGHRMTMRIVTEWMALRITNLRVDGEFSGCLLLRSG
ncbi:hypothetical protein ACTJKF_02360 [Burkholderia sp. 22313]